MFPIAMFSLLEFKLPVKMCMYDDNESNGDMNMQKTKLCVV